MKEKKEESAGESYLRVLRERRKIKEGDLCWIVVDGCCKRKVHKHITTATAYSTEDGKEYFEGKGVDPDFVFAKNKDAQREVLFLSEQQYRNQAHACYEGAEMSRVKRLALLAEDALDKNDIEGARALLEEINADKAE